VDAGSREAKVADHILNHGYRRQRFDFHAYT
jgi:hypothetical protein